VKCRDKKTPGTSIHGNFIDGRKLFCYSHAVQRTNSHHRPCDPTVSPGARSNRVEAVILDAKFDLRDIHVKVPERGTIRISGVFRENDAKDRLIQLVNGMAGVSKVEDNVAVVSLFVN